MTSAEIATLSALAVLGALAWWYAAHAGRDEAEQIARNIALNVNEDLPHDELLMQRIGWLGSAWIAIWMILGARPTRTPRWWCRAIGAARSRRR